MIVVDGAKLVAAAVESGYCESEMCIRAGVAHQTWAKIKKNQMVQYPALLRICKFLGVKPADVIKEAREDQPGAGPK